MPPADPECWWVDRDRQRLWLWLVRIEQQRWILPAECVSLLRLELGAEGVVESFLELPAIFRAAHVRVPMRLHRRDSSNCSSPRHYAGTWLSFFACSSAGRAIQWPTPPGPTTTAHFPSIFTRCGLPSTGAVGFKPGSSGDPAPNAWSCSIGSPAIHRRGMPRSSLIMWSNRPHPHWQLIHHLRSRVAAYAGNRQRDMGRHLSTRTTICSAPPR